MVFKLGSFVFKRKITCEMVFAVGQLLLQNANDLRTF